MVATWVLCLLGSKVCLQCSADHLLVCVQRLFGFFHWLSSSPRACLFGFIRLFFCFIRCLFGSTRSLLSCIRWLLASARWLFTSARGAGCVSLANLCLKSLMIGFRKTKMTQIRKPIQKEGKKNLLNKLTLLLHSAAINWKSFCKSVN